MSSALNNTTEEAASVEAVVSEAIKKAAPPSNAGRAMIKVSFFTHFPLPS